MTWGYRRSYSHMPVKKRKEKEKERSDTERKEEERSDTERKEEKKKRDESRRMWLRQELEEHFGNPISMGEWAQPRH